MTNEARVLRPPEANRLAKMHIYNFLLEQFARPEQARKVSSIGFSTEKGGGYDWVNNAYFLGVRKAKVLGQFANGNFASASIVTESRDRMPVEHRLMIENFPPVVGLPLEPGNEVLITRATVKNSAIGHDMRAISPEYPLLHIPTELMATVNEKERYKVDSSLLLNIPKHIQAYLGINLPSTDYVIATGMSPVTQAA